MNIGKEVGLQNARIIDSDHGRIPGTGRQSPSHLRAVVCSDNLAYLARRSV